MKEVPLVLLFTSYPIAYRGCKIFQKLKIRIRYRIQNQSGPFDRIAWYLTKGGPNYVARSLRVIYYWLFGFKFDRSNEGDSR